MRLRAQNLYSTENYKNMKSIDSKKNSKLDSKIWLFQSTDKGERFVDLLVKQGIVPGIKLDLGVVPLTGTIGEGTTQGLDKLAERAAMFKKVHRLSINERFPFIFFIGLSLKKTYKNIIVDTNLQKFSLCFFIFLVVT